jgi:hypothetical protein
MNKGIFCGLTLIGGGFLGADIVTGMAILFITWSLAYVLAVIKD